MNCLRLDRKVFCQRSTLQSYKAYMFICSKLFLFLYCIIYMGVSGPSLLRESTDSMMNLTIEYYNS